MSPFALQAGQIERLFAVGVTLRSPSRSMHLASKRVAEYPSVVFIPSEFNYATIFAFSQYHGSVLITHALAGPALECYSDKG
jgi:hypothetical protein